jgi:type IV secretory pathway TrbL component
MHCSLVFVLFIAFGFCAAQNYTLPPCAQVCAGTAATAAGCYSSSNATCVCASQPFQAAIQSCFDTSCNTTTQGTAWQYYSYLCNDASSASSGASIYSGTSSQSKTTTVSASTGSRPVTSHISSTQTSSLSSTQSANASSTTTSTSRTSTSTSGALGTEVERLCGFLAVVVGGALIL